MTLDGSGGVVERGAVKADGWLDAVRRFVAGSGPPLEVTGLLSMSRPDGCFLVAEPSWTRMFLVGPDEEAVGRVLTQSLGSLVKRPEDEERAQAPSQRQGKKAAEKKGHQAPERQEYHAAEKKGPRGTFPGVGGGQKAPGPRATKTRGSEALSAPAKGPAPGVRGGEGETQKRDDGKGQRREGETQKLDAETQKAFATLEALASQGTVGETGEMLFPHRLLQPTSVKTREGRVFRFSLVTWPDPPRQQLKTLVQAYMNKVRETLPTQKVEAGAVVAAFDHAFDRVAMRPPLAAAVWNGRPDETPWVLVGKEAQDAWPSRQGGGIGFSDPGESGRVMVPAIRLDSNGRPQLATPAPPPPAPPSVGERALESVTEGKQGDVHDAAPGQQGVAPGISEVEPKTVLEAKDRAHGSSSLLFMAFDELRDIYDAKDKGDVVQAILDAVAKLVPAKATAVYLYTEPRDTLRLVRLRTPQGAPLPQIEVGLGGGLVGACARQGLALSLSHVQRDVRFGSACAAALGINPLSLLAAPAQFGGRLFGALELVDARDRPSFTGGEVEVVAYAARLLGERLAALDDGSLSPPAALN